MNTLIVYASKYGCTEDCANQLKGKLSGNVTVINVDTIGNQQKLEGFDTILIGGSVYVGKISKKLRAFCEGNIDLLTKKKIGIFLCCALVDEVDKTLADNFPAALLKHSKSTKVFGSEARLDKMGFVDKMLIKAVTKGDFSKFKISSENILAFAKEMGL